MAPPVTAFTVVQRSGAARAGALHTAHGTIHTPAFMPVGTHAAIRALLPGEVRAAGAEVLLCNAYHLALRPGVELIERAGGLHAFMGWNGPILTDSGGYQLVSLGRVTRVDDEAADFVSPFDGTSLRVTPELAMDIQVRLGADIVMCLDHPVAWGARQELVRAATERTHRWAQRCRDAMPAGDRLLFGIAQGGFDASLRTESARAVAAMGFDGLAVGGLSVGEPHDVMHAMLEASLSQFPEERPRYFMGLGTDAEILAAVSAGVDLFDCVVPTRLARHATAVTDEGRISLRKAGYREDLRPLEAGCDCVACASFSRAYLRHLFGTGDILAHRLVTVHNLTHMSRLMAGVRSAIVAGAFPQLQMSVQSGRPASAAG
ncbi:MAG: tRNA guanosine(34) transglycosylase Tgt [Candidatus Dormibacteraeota bacterium]|nr:tRNA guanosine(34) transglycosylase Tgt [Candidatus Dormibacteraeota bacterium]